MVTHEAVEFLYNRFGMDPFKVVDLDDEELYELMDLMQLPMNPNDHGNRIRVGQNLIEAANDGLTFHLPSGPWLQVRAENYSDQDSGETATYYLY